MTARRLGIALALGLAIAAFLTSTALGQSDLVYDFAGGTQGQLGETGSGGGALPFTGLNLALIVIGGLVLIGTGAALRFRRRATD